ncbi:Hpt domain protein [Jannaschia seosinensis]|uniref:Hpt domain protein n=1 Tax=Jannaschia seosinensis TaxID=313367 RepID=A0A0M7BFM4_9RHOB|nr:Hpt domain-containing protein [Jannaschia seosinensis]CUH40713.1 Hpt domain protein [Jannaschia seosinensis]
MKARIRAIARRGVKVRLGSGRDGADMIDRDRIAELESEIGADDLCLVLAMYYEEAAATIERIAVGLPPEECARELHSLRNGALDLGLEGLVKAAGRFETDAGESHDADTIAQRLRDLLDRTRAELSTDELAA